MISESVAENENDDNRRGLLFEKPCEEIDNKSYHQRVNSS